MSMKKSSPSRREWRRGRSAALANVLRGLAAMEGIRLDNSNDVGRLRNDLRYRMRTMELPLYVVDVALANAAQEYDKTRPKPPN